MNLSLHPFVLAAALLAALAACTREDAKPASETQTISIEASIGPMTKVHYEGNNSTFEANDQVLVYAWTGDKTVVPASRVVDGVANTLGTDGQWHPATQMLWADMTTAHTFLGIAPVHTVTDFTADAFTLNPADFTASDLLIAVNSTGLKATDNPVPLQFDHAMAKINVNLAFRNQWPTPPTVSSVTLKARKTATVNYLAAEPVTATGTADAVALNRLDNAAWTSLQIPQTGVNTITITIEGKNYVFTHTSDIPLSKGQYTTVNLIVGRNTIDLGSVSISPWTAGPTIDGGEAQTND